MTQNHQVIYRRFDAGNPGGVHELVQSDIPDIGADEVLVRMRCAPVHPCDTLCAMGLVNGVALPSVGGTEGLGVIEKVGADIQNQWRQGQRVQVTANYVFGDWSVWQGVWSEYVVRPGHVLIPVPDEIEDDVGAQFMVNPLTAFAMVKSFPLGPGKVLMQTAAGSVLGRLMIQLAGIYGFETINIVRRQQTADELKNEFGIETAYVYDGSEGSAAALKAAIVADFKDKPINYCIEAVGGETARLCLDLLGPSGDLYIYGSMTGEVSLTVNTVADLAMRNNALKGWSTQETWLRQTDETTKHAYVDELMALIASGQLKLPAAGERFTLPQVADAMAASVRPGRVGKVMIDCDS